MNDLPFHRGSGRLYRGNLHTHSTNSDGGMTPEQVCAAYKQQGYDFVTITDHYMPERDYIITDSTPYRDETFTTLVGSELHAPALANGQTWHILAAGLPLDFGGLRDGETGPELAQRAIDAGAFVGLAHPAWYGATIADLQSIPNAHAIEAYNEVCAGLTDRAESWSEVDHLLTLGRRVTAFGADDAHFRDFSRIQDLPEEGDLEAQRAFMKLLEETAVAPDGSGTGDTHAAGFSAWVWVWAERLDPDLIVASLKAGRYYTSRGPVIHDITVSDDRKSLTVVNSPAVSVWAVGTPAKIIAGSNHAKQITKTTFDISKHAGGYVRVTVLDAAGKRAWSNPIWLD